MQDKCGRSPCGARMSILADSIRLSQGCLPAVLFRFSVYAPYIYVRHIFFFIFICIYQKFFVILHRLSERTDKTY